MNTTAIQTKDRPETDTGPLRILHSTIAAFVISGDGFDNGLIAGAHLHHDGNVAFLWKVLLERCLVVVDWGNVGGAREVLDCMLPSSLHSAIAASKRAVGLGRGLDVG